MTYTDEEVLMGAIYILGLQWFESVASESSLKPENSLTALLKKNYNFEDLRVVRGMIKHISTHIHVSHISTLYT